MSTKTTFKRIALVAVAALGLGVLSVAPSSAIPTGVTVTATNGQAGLPNAAADSLTAGILTIAGLLEVNDSLTVEIVAKSYPAGAATPASRVYLQNLDSTTPGSASAYTVDTVTASSAATVQGAAGGTFVVNGAHTSANTTVARISKQTAAGFVSHTFGVQFDSATATTRVAGTYTFTALVKSWGSATPVLLSQDISIVIAAAASTSTTVDTTKLSAFIASTNAAVADANVSAVATAASTVAYIYVKIANASGDTTTALDSVTATVTGPGVISFDGTTWGKSIKYSATGNQSIQIRGDGVAGSTSIAVSTTSGLSVTKTMSFYSKDAKTITPTVFTPLLGLGANDSAVAVTAVDANGTNWTGALYIYPVAAADALVSGAITAAVACVASSDNSKKYCPITTKTTGTASFKVGNNADPSLATVTSDAVKVTVSNATAASVKIAFDKATYAPGEKAVVTVTPLDSTGNVLAAGTGNYLAAALTSNVSFVTGGASATSLAAASVTTAAYAGTDQVAGSQSFVIYMPTASGTLTLTGKGGTSLPLAGQVAVTASANVVNASVDAATDAANEATDAANAATDAALAAADAADAATAAAQDASDAVAALSATVATLVASLKAQLTSLTNLVIKIQKKVKA